MSFTKTWDGAMCMEDKVVPSQDGALSLALPLISIKETLEANYP